MAGKNLIEEIEKSIKDFNEVADKNARPILRRYPLLFAFLVTFGVAAILDGIRVILDEIEFFKSHPFILILIGILILLLTGKLYKVLNKEKE